MQSQYKDKLKIKSRTILHRTVRDIINYPKTIYFKETNVFLCVVTRRGVISPRCSQDATCELSLRHATFPCCALPRVPCSVRRDSRA